jgi:hypothetical protein
MEKIKPVFVKTDNGISLFQFHKPDFIKEYDHITARFVPNEKLYMEDNDILFHGQYDIMRKDKYKFASRGASPGGYDFFVECFYEMYGIDYENRISCFEITRDKEAEERVYAEFIEENGSDYVVYHDMAQGSLRGDTRDTRIEFSQKLEGYNYVNLHRRSNVFFDYIKVVQNSKEAHFVDSIWAAICYQLDAKYSLFKDVKINVYCKRGHNKMFYTPKKLENWNVT